MLPKALNLYCVHGRSRGLPRRSHLASRRELIAEGAKHNWCSLPGAARGSPGANRTLHRSLLGAAWGTPGHNQWNRR